MIFQEIFFHQGKGYPYFPEDRMVTESEIAGYDGTAGVLRETKASIDKKSRFSNWFPYGRFFLPLSVYTFLCISEPCS
jgi:hypothetical protein